MYVWTSDCRCSSQANTDFTKALEAVKNEGAYVMDRQGERDAALQKALAWDGRGMAVRPVSQSVCLPDPPIGRLRQTG